MFCAARAAYFVAGRAANTVIPVITTALAHSILTVAILDIACVASVSSRGSSRKLGQEQKKLITGEGEGNENLRTGHEVFPLRNLRVL